MASTEAVRRGGIRPPVSDAKRDVIIALMLDLPDATDTEIAATAHVSRTVVQRLRRELAPDVAEVTEEYGRQLAKRLPMRERVRLWAQLSRGKVDPRLAFAQKAALQRVEELIGHVTVKEKRETDAQAAVPQPIFVLPAGAALVSVQQPLQVVVQGVSGDVPDKDKAASD